jgi:glycerophosphoryl diester phosphodiesterase
MKPMFWHLRRKGVLVIFWNINSEQEYDRAITYPIDGILTDRPELIRQYADKLRGATQEHGSGERLSNGLGA